MRPSPWIAALVVVFVALGCLRPGMVGPSGSAGGNAALTAAPPIQGRVDLSALAARQVLAQMGDVAKAATVSLIDPAVNQTIATSFTDAEGAFNLNFGPSFAAKTTPYFLEAVKGLSSNAAGSSAARVRTLVQFAGGGWVSISTPGLTVSRGTTALCAIASLKSSLPTAQQINLPDLIGKLAISESAETFTPITNCTLTNYNDAYAAVNAALAAEGDPMALIAYTSDTDKFSSARGVKITATTPSPLTNLMEGQPVTISGLGFDPLPGNNTVKFGSTLAVVTGANATTLTVSMRGLTAGFLTVQVGNAIYQGPAFTVTPFVVGDGSNAPGTDNAYQFTPVNPGGGQLSANWPSNPNAQSYTVAVGTAPGASNVKSAAAAAGATSLAAGSLSLQGAWTGKKYYFTVTPNFPSGSGTPVTSNGVGVAEAVSWDGVSTSIRNNGYDAGYSSNFPPGSNKTQFYGAHYFETVNIAAGATVYVQPFGKVDNILPDATMNDTRTTSPHDGWLAVYANTITLASGATIDASGRGYGGGPGGSTTAASSGSGGSGGLSGNGGSDGAGIGGQGFGAGGGGATGAACGNVAANGGRSGYFGGGGGGGYTSAGGQGNDTTAAGGIGLGSCPGAAGLVPFGHGGGGRCDNSAGGGGAGYGAGGGGGVNGCGGNPGGGGGGGGTGGGTLAGTVTQGLGWAPGLIAYAVDAKGGPAGKYLPQTDASIDRSWILGSGGAGGNPHGTGEKTTGGGGGAGGGAVILGGNTVTIAGAIHAVGAAGGGGAGNNDPSAGGGGGGSGGTILLDAVTLSLTGTLNALGGTSGGNGGPAGTRGGDGGDGAAAATGGTLAGGTIKVFYRTLSAGAMPTTANAGRVYQSQSN